MQCPVTHEWYELERGDLPRDHGERLRRHLASCPACRAHADGIRGVAAALETLAGRTRAELSNETAVAVLRRGRVHGLVGRRFRRPLTVRLARSRWVRTGLPLAAAAVGAVLIVVGLQIAGPPEVVPRGALDRLARESAAVDRVAELARLAPLARAAVSEELARPAPGPDQVADLLLVAYITQRPRENRQIEDVRFLLAGVSSRRAPPAAAAARPAPPMLASVLLAQFASPVEARGDTLTVRVTDPITMARSLILSGDYEKALETLRADPSALGLRAWCLEMLGRPAEASQLLAQPEGRTDQPLARVLRADLALMAQDLAEALRQYEMLAAERDRYWFAAGYLCRYELADPRGAGLRFERIHDPRLAGYVARVFQAELASVKEEPDQLMAQNFEGYDLGPPPENWALVMARPGEFDVVAVPRGKALQQDELKSRGAEFLTGQADWTDYTVQADIKVLESRGDYDIGVTACRRADRTGYVLKLAPHRLGVVKQLPAKDGQGQPVAQSARLLLEPVQAQVRLDDAPAAQWWYTLKLRVQRVAGGVSVAGKVWRADRDEPLGWQVVWTDTGDGGVGPLVGGLAGCQVSGAKVQIDNFAVTRNEAPRDAFAALK